VINCVIFLEKTVRAASSIDMFTRQDLTETDAFRTRFMDVAAEVEIIDGVETPGRGNRSPINSIRQIEPQYQL
jgi:hypothetical protein